MKSFKQFYTIILGIFILITTTQSSYSQENEQSKKLKGKSHVHVKTLRFDLEEITKEADRIFSGKCKEVKEIKYDEQSKLPIVQYTFTIDKNIKGLKDKKEITFKQWKAISNENGYKKGKKYILFLHGDSNIGLTSPVGLEQGLFEVYKEKTIIGFEELVINKLRNKGLTRNFKTQKLLRIGDDEKLTSYIQSASENGKPIRYRDFIKAIGYFIQ